jgi:hypothetical protein
MTRDRPVSSFGNFPFLCRYEATTHQRPAAASHACLAGDLVGQTATEMVCEPARRHAQSRDGPRDGSSGEIAVRVEVLGQKSRSRSGAASAEAPAHPCRRLSAATQEAENLLGLSLGMTVTSRITGFFGNRFFPSKVHIRFFFFVRFPQKN